ncbi:MAG: acyl-CoA synthetase [Bacteroidota bacterium]
MDRKTIAVIGESVISKKSMKYKSAIALGKMLVDNNFRIQHGGRGGVMEAVTIGARMSKKYREGMVIGILPGFSSKKANSYLEVVFPTGLDIMRNFLVVNADAVVVIGGKAGTLSEIAIAWLLKKMIIAYDIEGWSGKLAGTKIDSRKRVPFKDDIIFKVSNENEVLDYLNKYLELYNKNYTRIG